VPEGEDWKSAVVPSATTTAPTASPAAASSIAPAPAKSAPVSHQYVSFSNFPPGLELVSKLLLLLD